MMHALRGTARRDDIVAILRRQGYLSVSELASMLGVDHSTVRRDLMELAREGLINRTHGGALPIRDEAELPYVVKSSQRIAQKEAIAKAAASMTEGRHTVIIDSGSTMLMLAHELRSRDNLTVLTPDIRVAAELIDSSGLRLIVPGGEVLASTSTLTSQEAVEAFTRYRVDVAFIGADAVDTRQVSNFSSAVVPLKRAMIAAAERVVLMADSSKLDSRRLVSVAPLQDFDEMVTDSDATQAQLDAYPIRVIRAPVGQQAF